MKNMKVLVIGGTRFFGYSIARRLVDKGHSVTLFNRGQTPDEFGESVERIHGDRNEHLSFIDLLKERRFDAVIDMISFRAEDTQTAVKAFSGKMDHFIHISTGAVYLVTQDYPTPLKEEDFDRPLYTKPDNRDEWWIYGFHKRECEQVLQKAFQESGFPSTVFRLPIVIGERDYTLRAYSYFIRVADGKPMIVPDGGLNVFTLVYQDDIARTVVDNLLNSVSYGQAYNLAQDNIMTTKSFIDMAAGILGKKTELVDIPSGLLNRTRLKTTFSPFFSRRAFVLDVAKAKRDLQYRATPPKEWMTKTIRWFDEKYSGSPPGNYALRDREVSLAEKYKAAMKALLKEL